MIDPDAALADRVTLVLLTYNCAHRVTPIVEYARKLGVPVIAVDNGSTDGTGRLLRSWPDVDVVELDRNLGAAARNLGVQRARTPYVAFCDDDGWYEQDGLANAVAFLDARPKLALVNARILVGPDELLDPICAEMAESPLPDRDGVPGAVLLGFMAGAAVVRVDAYREVGGYEPRFWIAGEEETLAMKLVRRGWLMRYREDVVMHHEPSIANAPYLRAYGMRNTLWNAWQHRRLGSALRWTHYILTDSPKNADWLHGTAMALRGMPGILRRRDPMPPDLDAAYALLDARRFAQRRPFWTRADPLVRLRVGPAPRPGVQRRPQP